MCKQGLLNSISWRARLKIRTVASLTQVSPVKALRARPAGYQRLRGKRQRCLGLAGLRLVKPVRRACARGSKFGQDASLTHVASRRARAVRAKCRLAGLTRLRRAIANYQQFLFTLPSWLRSGQQSNND